MYTSIRQWLPALGVTLSILVTLGGCASPPESSSQASEQKKAVLTIDGSSTVFPITNEIAQEYQLLGQDKPEIRVQFSGTGGGFKKFCAGETDINNASRPISKEEMVSCKMAGVTYIELPVAYDALTVAVNANNNWANTITTQELKKIWEPRAEGKINQWNQVRVNWPNRPLTLYGAGGDSGTFDYFTEAIVGQAKASRQDYKASEDDTLLVKGISNDVNGLGYFGYSYYEENKTTLKALGIENNGEVVLPSPETVLNGKYQPLARPLFIYVNAEKAKQKSQQGLALRAFVEYYLTEGRHFVKVVGYIPLTHEIYNLALTHFQDQKIGTVFGGKSEFNLKIEDLLQKETEF